MQIFLCLLSFVNGRWNFPIKFNGNFLQWKDWVGIPLCMAHNDQSSPQNDSIFRVICVIIASDTFQLRGLAVYTHTECQNTLHKGNQSQLKELFSMHSSAMETLTHLLLVFWKEIADRLGLHKYLLLQDKYSFWPLIMALSITWISHEFHWNSQSTTGFWWAIYLLCFFWSFTLKSGKNMPKGTENPKVQLHCVHRPAQQFERWLYEHLGKRSEAWQQAHANTAGQHHSDPRTFMMPPWECHSICSGRWSCCVGHNTRWQRRVKFFPTEQSEQNEESCCGCAVWNLCRKWLQFHNWTQRIKLIQSNWIELLCSPCYHSR